MTANLENMMKFRDLQVAEDFARMVEMGYMDKEFTVYGCAYFEHSQRWYLVSTVLETINDFILESSQKRLYPTAIMTLRKTCPVPLGQDENIVNDLKKQLAKQLQDAYPLSFFEALQFFATQPANDGAYALLESLRQQLEGVYHREQLLCFEGLLRLADQGKVISEAHQQILWQWLEMIYAQMVDDVVVTDIFERTFYGIAYRQGDEKVEWYVNAKRDSIDQRKTLLEEQGAMVSPIFTKTYGYNYTYKLSDARDDFVRCLQQRMGEDYMAQVRRIRALPSAIDSQHLRQQVLQLQDQGKTLAAQTMTAYGRRWHC